jgi:chitin disaccharide deacetylase
VLPSPGATPQDATAGAPPRPLVVEADDLGLTRSFNEGIRAAAREGWLTSTCARVNGPAFDAALAEVVPDCPALAVGIHLNLVEGRTTRSRVARSSPLCDADGAFRLSFSDLLRMQHRPALIAEVEADFRDQIERALARLPGADHLNSHQHSHAVPALFEVVCRLSLEYGIPWVRLPRERPYLAGPLRAHLRPWFAANSAKSLILNRLATANLRTAARYGVRTNEWLVGILYTGYMDAATVLDGLARVGGCNGVAELLLHPTLPRLGVAELYLDDEVRRYALAPERARELATLRDASVAERLRAAGWSLTRYGALATTSRGATPAPPRPSSANHAGAAGA